MINKTWNIGEYCKGGVVTVEINDKQIDVIGKDWDYSVGHNKNSNQSNAKEFNRLTVNSNELNAERKIRMFMCDLCTSYYSDVITDWIKTKIELKSDYEYF